ncbi:MAG: transposase [Panacagrimonas sp.]
MRNRQWDRIKDLLPGKARDRGAHAKDKRLFLEAVRWIGSVDGPWCDLPP